MLDLVQLPKDQVPKVGLAENVAREVLNGLLELIKGQIVEGAQCAHHRSPRPLGLVHHYAANVGHEVSGVVLMVHYEGTVGLHHLDEGLHRGEERR